MNKRNEADHRAEEHHGGEAGELTHTSVGAELAQRAAESSEAILNMSSV